MFKTILGTKFCEKIFLQQILQNIFLQIIMRNIFYSNQLPREYFGKKSAKHIFCKQFAILQFASVLSKHLSNPYWFKTIFNWTNRFGFWIEEFIFSRVIKAYFDQKMVILEPIYTFYISHRFNYSIEEIFHCFNASVLLKHLTNPYWSKTIFNWTNRFEFGKNRWNVPSK